MIKDTHRIKRAERRHSQHLTQAITDCYTLPWKNMTFYIDRREEIKNHPTLPKCGVDLSDLERNEVFWNATLINEDTLVGKTHCACGRCSASFYNHISEEELAQIYQQIEDEGWF